MRVVKKNQFSLCICIKVTSKNSILQYNGLKIEQIFPKGFQSNVPKWSREAGFVSISRLSCGAIHRSSSIQCILPSSSLTWFTNFESDCGLVWSSSGLSDQRYKKMNAASQRTIVASQLLDTVQKFLIKLGIKPHLHILKISIYSLNHVIVRPTKIINNLLKICTFKVIFQPQK